MKNLYADPVITAGYLHLMELSRASQSPDQSDMASAAYETFFESLITTAYASLQYVSPQRLPELHLHAWRGESNALARLNAKTMFTDRGEFTSG